MRFTTKEISRVGFQTNMVAAKIDDGNKRKVVCLLCDGTTIVIEAPNEENARTVLHTLLYYPLNNEHAGHEFKFEVTIVI